MHILYRRGAQIFYNGRGGRRNVIEVVNLITIIVFKTVLRSRQTSSFMALQLLNTNIGHFVQDFDSPARVFNEVNA